MERDPNNNPASSMEQIPGGDELDPIERMKRKIQRMQEEQAKRKLGEESAVNTPTDTSETHASSWARRLADTKTVQNTERKTESFKDKD